MYRKKLPINEPNNLTIVCAANTVAREREEDEKKVRQKIFVGVYDLPVVILEGVWKGGRGSIGVL